MATSFSQNSLRILSALRKKSSNGYELFKPLGFRDAKEMAEAVTPLVDAGLLHYAGTPYTETGMLEAQYGVLPSRAAYVDQLLYFTPVRLSDAPNPPDNSLSNDTRLVLEKLLEKIGDGYMLMNAIGTTDTKRLADALNPLAERGLVTYAGLPFTDDGLKNAWYSIPPSQTGYARAMLHFTPPKIGGQMAGMGR